MWWLEWLENPSESHRMVVVAISSATLGAVFGVAGTLGRWPQRLAGVALDTIKELAERDP